MDRYKEGYNDCDLDWRKRIQGAINKLDEKAKELHDAIPEKEIEEYSDANISFELMDIEIRKEELQNLLKKG